MLSENRIRYDNRILPSVSCESPKDLGPRIKADYQEIMQSLQLNCPWDVFVEGAVARWEEYLPLQIGEFIQPLDTISPILPQIISNRVRLPSEKTYQSAWRTWREFLRNNILLYPYLAVCGPIGNGKSNLVDCLAANRPHRSPAIIQQELWQQNPYLDPLYLALGKLEKSEPFDYSSLGDLPLQSQQTFASLKFRQGLKAMALLRKSCVIQDVHFSQDGVYLETLAQLGFINPEQADRYAWTHYWRKSLLPKYIQKPILIYSWLPLAKAKERIVERARAMEQQMPPNYLEWLHLNTLQWALAMQQRGCPLIIVDAEKYNFSENGKDRALVSQRIWEEVYRIYPEHI